MEAILWIVEPGMLVGGQTKRNGDQSVIVSQVWAMLCNFCALAY